MFIRKVDRFYRKQDGTVAAYDYYHLAKSYRDAKGRKHNRCVLCMGRLEGFTRRERDELADMLTVMIEKGRYVMHENRKLYEKAMGLYAEYRESKYARENDPILIAEAERMGALEMELQTARRMSREPDSRCTCPKHQSFRFQLDSS